MAKKKNEVTSVRGVSVNELWTMLREGKPFPEGVCRNYELDPPFFDCDQMEEYTSELANRGNGLVVNKAVPTKEEVKVVEKITRDPEAPHLQDSYQGE